MKCFKDLKKTCTPRKCNKQCYIKDNHKFQNLLFNEDTDIQKNVNNYFITSCVVEFKNILPRIQKETYDKFKIFPNARAYHIVEKTIENIDYGLIEPNEKLVKMYKQKRRERKNENR